MQIFRWPFNRDWEALLQLYHPSLVCGCLCPLYRMASSPGRQGRLGSISPSPGGLALRGTPAALNRTSCSEKTRSDWEWLWPHFPLSEKDKVRADFSHFAPMPSLFWVLMGQWLTGKLEETPEVLSSALSQATRRAPLSRNVLALTLPTIKWVLSSLTRLIRGYPGMGTMVNTYEGLPTV